jgi:EpsI family protein
MPQNRAGVSFLGSKYARIATLFMIAQVIGLYAVSRREKVPLARPLAEFPAAIQGWKMVDEGGMDQETLEVLRADDVLSRTYYDAASNRGAHLFVAYFQSQRTGQAPHSPKNCLPGSGWVPSESGIVSMTVPGAAAPIEMNRYVVTKGEDRSVVLYWYQTRDRVIASEYRARIYMVADAIRYNRTDTALVRVVVPVQGNQVEAAVKTAQDFVAAFFARLRQHLPS